MKDNVKNIVIIILLIIILGGVVYYFTTQNMNETNNAKQEPSKGQEIAQQEEEEENETKAEDIQEGTEITTNDINLNDYTSNITITKSGEYTLTGNFENSVLVDADGEVTLKLNNVTIKSKETSAIANRSQNDLKIDVLDGTTNSLTDNGKSVYDGCIYSNGHLTISGTGKINVYGKQDEGEGIATKNKNITINGGNINIECNDDGINTGGDNGGTIEINDGDIYIKASGDGIDSNKNVVINGGTVYSMGSANGGDAGLDADNGVEINGGDVIALGSDMLEEPLSTSKQKFICFNLNSAIDKDTTITLKNEAGNTVKTFKADEGFKTLIISNKDLTSGTYYLYKDNEKVGESKI